jgi:hypothetical protein
MREESRYRLANQMHRFCSLIIYRAVRNAGTGISHSLYYQDLKSELPNANQYIKGELELKKTNFVKSALCILLR